MMSSEVRHSQSAKFIQKLRETVIENRSHIYLYWLILIPHIVSAEINQGRKLFKGGNY